MVCVIESDFLKILYVISGLGIGGAESLVVNLADKMVSRGHQVMIVSLTGPTLFRPVDTGIRVAELEMAKSPVGFVCGYLALRQFIRELRPDVIHSHMIHANLLARLVRLSINVPRLVCTAHSTNEGGRLRMMAYRLTDFLADVSTNVSREAVEAFEAKGAVPRGQMLAVLNGIDCDVFSPDVQPRLEIREVLSVDRDPMVFIAVGRLFEAKDYPNLLTAFAEVSASLPNSFLWIVGDGPLRVELENMSGDLGLAERVRFLGVRYDIPALLRAADVFVLSSSWEGFGLVVAEAMATGTRVVATDCGGVREVVGDCGYLVPPCDSKALGNAMLVAANLSAEQVETLGRTARQRIVELFSLDRAVDRWLEIYSGKGV